MQRVKILFNKKDTALIQMAEPQQAIHAINHLDKVKLWGKAIRVMHSKHTNVQVNTFFNALFLYGSESTSVAVPDLGFACFWAIRIR